MEPFGMGNEEPVFLSKNCQIIDLKFIGEKKNHLSLILEQDKKRLKALFFNVDFDVKLYIGQKLDVVYKIRKNDYNGNTSIDLNLIDFKVNNE